MLKKYVWWWRGSEFQDGQDYRSIVACYYYCCEEKMVGSAVGSVIVHAIAALVEKKEGTMTSVFGRLHNCEKPFRDGNILAALDAH